MVEQHANDPLLGAMFHDYRIEQPLAQGGMGSVYLCRHKELPHLRKVLKVIATEAFDEQAASAAGRADAERTRAFLSDRFEREAVAVSQLHHRYIVPIDGIGTVAGRRCILMPFLEGRPLDQVLQERGGMLTPHETLHVAAQIARALDYAHRRGIVHRDLKPANIFVTPSDDDPLTIKVIDFGIAKQMQAPTATAWRGPIGTLLFMAVEQFEHASTVTAAADVYSLAVMVYLMVTGRYPWGEGHSAFALYDRQRHMPPDPALTLPVGWEAVLLSALSPDPQQRPQSMRELVYPLAMLLAECPPYRSGIEILRLVARRWVEFSPVDETLRGSAATSGAWQAFTSGAWRAAPSGSWPVTPSGSWSPASSGAWSMAPSGSWPGGSWPSVATPLPSLVAPMPSTQADIPTDMLVRSPAGMWVPSAWKLALLAVAAAALAGLVVLASVAVVRVRSSASAVTRPSITTAAPGGQ